MSAPTALDVAGLLELLGFTDGEFVSLIYWDTDDVPHTAVMRPADAIAAAAKLPDTANVFFGVNPTRGPARKGKGRGKEADVTRLAALVCDLDLKPGGCPSRDVALAIVAELSSILGTRPSVIVDSGHGLHPYWPIDDGQVTDGDITAARALLKRWGRLVAHIAGNHNVHADNVFDLARVMRLPGSHNNKSTGNGEAPILVTAQLDTGGPLTMAEVDERLTEVGVLERDDDRAAAATEVSPPDDWTFADDYRPARRTCGYVAKMINAWRTDRPKPGGSRNHFVYDRYIRLFCAYRNGCITVDDYQRARQILADLLTELVTTIEPRRQPRKLEIAEFNKYGIKLVASKTDEQVRAELGDHDHDDAGGKAKTGGTGKTKTGGNRKADPQPKLWKARDLKPIAQPRFLAKDRIPRGAVTILCGDEGIGKSLLWVLLVVNVTTGKPFEGFGIPARAPAHVILVLTEDDWQTAVLPRLTVAGADLDMIKVICVDDDGSGSPIFPADMDLITKADPRPALIVVDAWLDTVPTDLQVRDAQQSRTALHPWKDTATRTDAAVMLLTHANRIATANMRDKYGATASLRQKARMTLYALADPDDGTLIVGPDKANSSGGRVKASRFRILGEVYFNPTPDHDGTVPSLQYAGSTGKTIRTHLAEIFDAKRRTPAEDWLIGFLAGGPQKAADVYAAGAAADGDFSKDQLKRAKEKVCGPAFKGTGADTAWYWELLPRHTSQQTSGGNGGQ